MFNPHTEFDDASMVEIYETYSPIFISGNEGPLIFVGNDFTQNIGTVGGVFHIQVPNFEKAMADY